MPQGDGIPFYLDLIAHGVNHQVAYMDWGCAQAFRLVIVVVAGIAAKLGKKIGTH